MVANRAGYHFMRRDSTTRLWSHKNGGGADNKVETVATKLHANKKGLSRHVEITDNVAEQLLLCVNATYAGFIGFTFAGYFLVPDAGFTVNGLAHRSVAPDR